MVPLALFLAASACLLALYKTIRLIYYIRQARATRLPYVITPLLETEAVALLATPFLRYLYHDYLNKGAGWPRWCRFIIKDWAWEDKRLAHDEYGDVFLCVSPEGIICYSADPVMGWDVMNRRNDFTKPRDKYKILEPYGPNVATAEGKVYQFHVRVTAPPFGDQSGANELVWSETLYQTKHLAEAWSREKLMRNLLMDVNSLTLAIISLAGFGKRIEWATASEHEIPKGYKTSFLKAISDTTANMVSILLFPKWLLSISPLRQVSTSYTELEKYMREMIRHEKANITKNGEYQNKAANGNLLTAILRSSAQGTGTEKDGKRLRKEGFTENEVMGNLFIYLLAGFETTANSIIYGLAVLALEKNIQDNVIEELDRVYAESSSAGRNTLSYAEDFEKLPYLYGFMYETFRLFPGVTLITKVANEPQNVTITHGGGTGETSTHRLPAGARVYLTAPSVHYHPAYWPEPYRIEPARWFQTISAGKAVATAAAAERGRPAGGKKVKAADKTRQMRGTLLTFSDGARACLGRKFAQAEYMAFFAQLLRDYRVELAAGSDHAAVKRDLYLKCAGKMTLAPLESVQFTLRRRSIESDKP